MKPEEALQAARAAAAKRDDELPPGMAIEPTERVSIEQLMEWAAIEPDIELMVSTRKLGAPITWFKRKVIHFLRQYFREQNSQQTRFNLNVLIRLAELEDRVARLEEARRAAAPRPRRAAGRRAGRRVRVHQVLSGAGPYDAVTTQAFAFRALFGAWGWSGRDVAAEIDPRVGSQIAPLRALEAGPGDVLLIHYSAYAPKLRAVLELPNRKLLLSHNITPARWFWDHDPQAAVVCALGRKQLPQFAAAADVVAGVSLYNAREMGSETVIPILFDPAELGAARAAGDPPPAPPTILFVGRLAPHKRQDAVMRAFELYRRRHAPDARLVLVGAPVNWAYDAAMRELAEELSPGAITIESGLTREQLADRYRSAHAFLCLSEHEGFCIPLLEAFHFGVPVIARPVGGVPEVAGDAALLLADDDGESVVAELLALAVADAGLRGELRERAARRVAAYAPEPTARALRAAVESLAR